MPVDPTANIPGCDVQVVLIGATPPLVVGGSNDTWTGAPSADCTSTFAGHVTVSNGGGGGAAGELPHAASSKAEAAATVRGVTTRRVRARDIE
jgi:hypothetical protein